MNEQQVTEGLCGRVQPRVPHSDPPDLEYLMIRVRRRRQTRTALATFVLAASGVLLIACMRHWNRTDRLQGNPRIGAVVRDDIKPLKSLDKSQEASFVESTRDPTTRVRVFAKVRQPIPIFDRQEGSEYVRHVGWIDSEEIVPVDLQRFSLEQQQSFEAVLYQDQTNSFFSL